MKTPKRYNPAMVVFHWLTVILFLGAGLLSEDEGGGSSPINIHMILGALLLLVMLIRLILRFAVRRPAWASTGNPIFDQLGELVHYGLYAIAFFILGMGAMIAYNRNLFAAALGLGTAGGRVGFLRGFHAMGWNLALLLILGHVVAAFYHQFFLKDHLLSRMWFGRDRFEGVHVH